MKILNLVPSWSAGTRRLWFCIRDTFAHWGMLTFVGCPKILVIGTTLAMFACSVGEYFFAGTSAADAARSHNKKTLTIEHDPHREGNPRH